MKLPRVTIIFAALVLIGAVLRIAALVTLPNLLSMEGESYSKLHLFLQWVESPLLYPDTNFGPLHMVLLWIPWKLTGSLVTANRILSLLFSVALFWPLFHLVKRSAGEVAALSAAAILAPAALPVGLACVTLAEGPYLFFFAFGLYFFVKFNDRKEKPDKGALMLFVLMMTGALALRFESWMFLPVWPICIWRARGFRMALLSAALLAVFPMIHMYMCHKIIGHPLQFLIQSAQITAINEQSAPLTVRAAEWGKTLLAVDGPAMLIAGIGGVILCLVRGPSRLIAVLFLWHFAVLEAQALRAALAPELYRYAALLVFLLIPPAAKLISDFSEKISGRRSELLIAVPLALVISATSLPYLHRIKQETDLAMVPYLVAEGLSENVTQTDRVFMGNESHPLLVVESGLSWSNFVLPIYPDGVRADPKHCKKIFKEWRPTKILVYRHDPTFKDILGIHACSEVKVFAKDFHPVFEHDPWCLLSEDAP